MNNEIAMDATDLTQLSSREQLSALMDGALPADETRFLLRRLQHDATLAECWERWRLSAEVMRGLAPAQRLPSDFASRVAASLRHRDTYGEAVAEAASGEHATRRAPAWLRWGGGAAMAASLAVVAFMTQPVVVGSPDSTTVAVTDAAPSHGDDAVALANAPAPKTPAPPAPAPAQDPAGAGFESRTAALASAVAIVARPARSARRGVQARAIQSPAILAAVNDVQPSALGVAAANDVQPLLPPVDIITRPWPRSVLPQYGNAGITVGFGDGARTAAPYNPFQLRMRIGNLPPALMEHPVEPDATSPDAEETSGAANGESPQS